MAKTLLLGYFKIFLFSIIFLKIKDLLVIVLIHLLLDLYWFF